MEDCFVRLSKASRVIWTFPFPVSQSLSSVASGYGQSGILESSHKACEERCLGDDDSRRRKTRERSASVSLPFGTLLYSKLAGAAATAASSLFSSLDRACSDFCHSLKCIFTILESHAQESGAIDYCSTLEATLDNRNMLKARLLSVHGLVSLL